MGSKLTKSICLTVPVVGENDAKVITPEPTVMKLVGAHPSMLYGFHGSTASKQPLLSAAYAAANKKERLTNKLDTYYLVDMTFRSPESFASEQHLLYGQLPPELLKKTPFIVARRLSAEAAYDLGKIWQECAKQEHGLNKVRKPEINWSLPADYMVAFPDVVDHVFAELPKLQCLLMPMRSLIMPAGSEPCTVGVARKATANKVEAEVRFRADVKVNLKFS